MSELASLNVTRFDSFKQKRSHISMSWSDLVEAAKSPVNVAKNDAPCISHHNLDVKTFSEIKEADSMTMLSIDIDSGDLSIETVHDQLVLLKISTAIIHSTATSKRLNSNNELNGRKWRILIPLSESISCNRWVALQTALVTKFQSDDCVTKPTQILFLPNNPMISDARETQHYEFMVLGVE